METKSADQLHPKHPKMLKAILQCGKPEIFFFLIFFIFWKFKTHFLKIPMEKAEFKSNFNKNQLKVSFQKLLTKTISVLLIYFFLGGNSVLSKV
jgi:hypothetical protein